MYFEHFKLFKCKGKGCTWQARHCGYRDDEDFETLIEQHEFVVHGVESDVWPTSFQRELGLMGGFGQMFMHHGSNSFRGMGYHGWGRGR